MKGASVFFALILFFLLVSQNAKVEGHAGCGHNHDELPGDPLANLSLSLPHDFYDVWVYALGSTLMVGCLPVIILSLLPSAMHQNPKHMKVLLAFAVGGLLGDVFLHLIPHAMDPHSHHEDTSHHDLLFQHEHHHHHEHEHDHEHDHDHHSHEIPHKEEVVKTKQPVEHVQAHTLSHGDHDHDHDHEEAHEHGHDCDCAHGDHDHDHEEGHVHDHDADHPHEHEHDEDHSHGCGCDHDHDHDHEEKHLHEEDHHDHDHDEDHDHHDEKTPAVTNTQKLPPNHPHTHGAAGECPFHRQMKQHSHDEPHHPHTHSHGHSHSHQHGHGHSHEGGEHNHDHSNYVGLCVLAGIISFLMVEKFVHILHGGDSHGHGHSHGEKKKDAKEVEEHHVVSPVAAYLNLVADFAHNVTDGLAIGASFKASHNLGVITTVAVLLHELPHEIGDYAILVQAGFSRKSAMIAQLYTAIGALVGTIIGLSVEEFSGSPFILPFTAGGFIYIAATSVLPSLLEKESLELWQSLKELFGILLGIGLMLGVGVLE